MTTLDRVRALAPAFPPLPVPAADHPRAQPRGTALELRLKRLIDIAGASAILLLCAPLMLVIALAVRLTSRGPVLHRYEMVGKDGVIFRGQKFRSMVANAHAIRHRLMAHNEMGGPFFKMANDPRVTPVGRILRKYSLDELPQLFSVLRGDMSLVGPRPPGPYEAEQFEPWHREKLRVTPGMTSLWIVRGKPKDIDAWVRLDIEYINTWSPWLDLLILLRTARVVLRGDNQ